MAQTPQNPSSSRLHGLDLARYFAFVGMVIVNFKIAMGVEGGTGSLGFLVTAIEGRAAATFIVLAGIGLGLAGVKGLDQTITVTIKRALFLLVIGLLNMTIFDADILHYYAFYFLFGVLLLPRGKWVLIGTLIALNLAFVIMILTLDYDAGWNWNSYIYSGFWTPIGFVRNLFFNGWHPVIPWLGFLLFGIVLSRVTLANRRTQLKLVAGGAIAFATAEGLSALLLFWLLPERADLAELLTTAPVPPMPLYMLAGIGAGCVVVGLCLLISDGLMKTGILRLLAPAGRQTLTLYIAHVLIGMGTLEAFGMLDGQTGEQTVGQAVAASLLFCAIATLYALIWSRWFKRGPVEALMRKCAG
jgi:uncharacterized membrane protein YeiB